MVTTIPYSHYYRVGGPPNICGKSFQGMSLKGDLYVTDTRYIGGGGGDGVAHGDPYVTVTHNMGGGVSQRFPLKEPLDILGLQKNLVPNGDAIGS